MDFADALIRWYKRHKRDLPWRKTRDPYRILVSELMLQQTRVAAVLSYYSRFLDRFPTIEALATAPEPDLLAAWSGLGYYRRARYLQAAAQEVVHRGAFPRTCDAIRSLPGVGDYTSAAVSSICFDQPRAAVDGNVLRVMSRICDEPGDIGSSTVKRRLGEAAASLLDPRRPGLFNQAMMELGATLCLPRRPKCLLCPVQVHCQAHREGREADLPAKRRRQAVVRVDRTLLIVRRDGALLMWRRDSADTRMPGFWELPELEQIPGARIRSEAVATFRHSITNHEYRFTVHMAAIRRPPPAMEWRLLDGLGRQPVSTVARKALRAAGIDCDS